jgi:hypothetical protein
MKKIPTFEEYVNESSLHQFAINKIDDKIEFLMNGDYDKDEDMLKDFKDALLKLAKTPNRENAIKYIEKKLKQ